jgi:hypothetical protein
MALIQASDVIRRIEWCLGGGAGQLDSTMAAQVAAVLRDQDGQYEVGVPPAQGAYGDPGLAPGTRKLT